MATANSEFSAEEDFKCLICFEHFDRKTRIPKRLHCPHSFCLLCLEQVPKVSNNRKILCPLCKESTPVKQSCDRLPTDITLLKLLDYLRCSDCSNITNCLQNCRKCQSLCCAKCEPLHERSMCDILKSVRDLESKDPGTLRDHAMERLDEWHRLPTPSQQKVYCDQTIDQIVAALETKRKCLHAIIDRIEDSFYYLNELMNCETFIRTARNELKRAEGPSMPDLMKVDCNEMIENVNKGLRFLQVAPKEFRVDTGQVLAEINLLGEEFVRMGYGPVEYGHTRRQNGKEREDEINNGKTGYMDHENGRSRLMHYWEESYLNSIKVTAEDYADRTEVTKVIEGTALGKFTKLQDVDVCPVTGHVFVADIGHIYELDPYDDWKLCYHFQTATSSIRNLCISRQRRVLLIGDFSYLGHVLVYSDTGQYLYRFGSGDASESLEDPEKMSEPICIARSFRSTEFIVAEKHRITTRDEAQNGVVSLNYANPRRQPNGVVCNGRGIYATFENENIVWFHNKDLSTEGDFPVASISADDYGRSSLAIDPKRQSLLISAWDESNECSYISVHPDFAANGCLARIESKKHPVRHRSVRLTATENHIIMADLKDNILYVF